MRCVRRSSSAWICTACGARSRFFARTTLAMWEGALRSGEADVDARRVQMLGWEKYESERVCSGEAERLLG